MAIVRPILTRVNNLVSGSLEAKIVFVHLPKCGGTSITSAIGERYKTLSFRRSSGDIAINAGASLKASKTFFGPDPFGDDYRSVLQFREYLLLYYLNLPDTRFIQGHFGFSDSAYREFENDFAFITVLRDPVKRWISAYFYNRYRTDCDWKIRDDLLEYLDSQRARANGCEYVKKLHGSLDSNVDYTSSEAIDKAKSNLDKFAVVGFLEDLDGFRKIFRDRFGVDLGIGWRNSGPKSFDFVKSVATEEVLDRIREICIPDLAVYQHAKTTCPLLTANTTAQRSEVA